MDIANGTTIDEKCPECGSKVTGVVKDGVAYFQCSVPICKTKWHYSVNRRSPSKKNSKFDSNWFKEYLEKGN